MKKTVLYFAGTLLFCGAALLACSNHNEAQPEPEKGMVGEMTHKAAKEVVHRIRTPLDRARSAADLEEVRLKDMDESLRKQ